MGTIRYLMVENYRSIGDPVRIQFPSRTPVVLVGENNAGKSNIIRALELIAGERWPGSFTPDDNDYHGRNTNNVPISITIGVNDVKCEASYVGATQVDRFELSHGPNVDRPYKMVLDNDRESMYVSNTIRDQCVCTVIRADRRLSTELSYSNKFTLLSKLMRSFHKSLMLNEVTAQSLRDKFGEIVELFYRVDEFSDFSSRLKQELEELSGNMNYGLQVDFSAYDPSNYFHALRVRPVEDGELRTYEELGTGQEQILAISFAYAYAAAFHDKGGLILVIEEPEVHLHTLAQEWIARRIREIAQLGVQVIITTHSPSFVDMMQLDGLVLVRKEEGSTHIIQLSRKDLAKYCANHGAPAAEADSILHFYSAIATKEILSGFFARAIVLVEGSTEAMALPILLMKVGLDTVKNGIAVIPVHGVGNLPKWWRLFTAYEIPTYVVFDSDSKDDKSGTRRSDVLSTLGINSDLITELSNSLEWRVEERFCVFGPDFETCMRSSFAPQYETFENLAKSRLGLGLKLSKPLAARYVANRLSPSEDNPGWESLRLLANCIQRLTATGQVDDLPF